MDTTYCIFCGEPATTWSGRLYLPKDILTKAKLASCYISAGQCSWRNCTHKYPCPHESPPYTNQSYLQGSYGAWKPEYGLSGAARGRQSRVYPYLLKMLENQQMNLFILDSDPIKAAQLYCDKHLTKIILESGQMLAAAHLEGGEKLPFTINVNKSQTNNHVTRWVRETKGNYQWAAQHAVALCVEYTYRQRKIHKWQSIISWLFANSPATLNNSEMTPFAQAVDDDCKHDDAVTAYRKYYNTTKNHLCKWTNREKPAWFEYIIPIIEG